MTDAEQGQLEGTENQMSLTQRVAFARSPDYEREAYHLSDGQRMILRRTFETWCLYAGVVAQLRRRDPTFEEYERGEVIPPDLIPFYGLATSEVSPAQINMGEQFASVTQREMLLRWIGAIPDAEVVSERDAIRLWRETDTRSSDFRSARTAMLRAVKRMEERGYVYRTRRGAMIAPGGIIRAAQMWRDHIDRLSAFIGDAPWPEPLESEQMLRQMVALPPR